MTVTPPAPYRLPGAVPDGVMRRHGGMLERVAGHGDQLVLLRAAQPTRGGDVVLGVWASDETLADEALDRWRRTLCVDVDHRPFLDLAWHDAVLGPLVRRRPWLRPSVRYRPHEALIWAITEQLIEYEDAVRIQRGLVRLAGQRCDRTGLRDVPTPRAILRLAPAQIEALGLAPRRVLLLRRTCELLVRGLDLDAPDRDPVWRRLRAVPGLGAWTLSCMASRGQGETNASPSGDLGLLKAVGRLMHAGLVELTPAPPEARSYDHHPSLSVRAAGEGRSGATDDGGLNVRIAQTATTVAPPPSRRDRRGRTPLATEYQVHELVGRYAPWAGYAAEHLFMV